MRTRSFGSFFRALALAVIVAVGGLLGPAAPLAVAQAPRTPQFEASACPFRVERRASGREILCGHVVVTEDRRNPLDDHTTRVAVVRVKAVDRRIADANPPILVLGGGPGQNTLEMAPWITGASISPFGGLTEDRDWLLMDQRGAGYSHPSLACGELDDINDSFSRPQADVEEDTYAAFDACRLRLTDAGINLEAYNSEEVANDVDDVRRALGYPRVDLFAVSYGTRVALRVMRQHPETIHAAVLDSVVPLEADFIGDLAVNFDESFRRLARACTASPACAARTPDLTVTLGEAVARLQEKPIKLSSRETPGQEAGPAAFLSVLLSMLYSPQLAAMIPDLVADVAEGRSSGLLISLLRSDSPSSESFSYGLYYSVNCSLDSIRTGQLNLPESVLPAIRDNLDLLAGYQRACEGWPSRAESVLPSAEKLNIPTLIIQGSFDPVTPPSYSKRAAATLSNVFYTEIESAGHSGTTTTSCGAWLVRQFLTDPSKRPADDCTRADKLQFQMRPPRSPSSEAEAVPESEDETEAEGG